VDVLAKVAAFMSVGALILAINLWYAKALYDSFGGGGIVIAPVKVYGANEKLVGLDENLSRLLLSSISTIEWSLEQSQAELRKPVAKESQSSDPTQPDASEKAVPPSSIGVIGLLGAPRLAGLDARLFEPSNIEATVGGVDVGGLLPRVQRWFVQDKILALSASFVDEKTVIVAGDIEVLKSGDPRPLRLKINAATPETIAEEIAYELVRRRLSTSNSFYERLQPDEFKVLVSSVGTVADINQRVNKYGIPPKGEYAEVSKGLSALADELTTWSELNHFAASVAESAEEYSEALALYERVRKLTVSPELAAQLDEKIAALKDRAGTTANETDRIALEKMAQSAAFATSTLNELFGTNRAAPPVKFPPQKNLLNAYWDGTSIFAPAPIKDIPDIIYHEAAWPFVQQSWSFRYEGEQGALVQSYTDVLASVVKQRKFNQTATTADWAIGEGAIAWLKDQPNQIKNDKRPLRSLKEPGTAYDDPSVGKDLQVAHFRDLIGQSNSVSEVHIYSGIPNKAFYETAQRLGTDTAAQIWIESLTRFDNKTDLRSAGRAIYAMTREKFGDTSDEAKAVKAAWNVVGLKL